MAGRAVSAVFSAGSVDVGGGVSNTPHSDVCKGSITNVVSNRVGIVNTCVDYLKIRFDGSFEKGDPRWLKLWGILRVDPSLFVERSGASGYLHGFDIEEGLSWFWGGAFTKSAIGEETCLMELKGSGCRGFEARVIAEHPGESVSAKDYEIFKAWDVFLKEIFALGGHCTRIDLPTDDFSGLVPFDGLKERIGKRAYLSSLRKFQEFPDFPQDFDSVEVFRSNTGYTATFGSRESVQLCIYNKKAEREAKGFAVLIPSWIRYEVRYYHDSAVSALAAFMASFDDAVGLEAKARRDHADCRLSKRDLEGKVRELVFQGESEADAWKEAMALRYSSQEMEAFIQEDVSDGMRRFSVSSCGPAGFIFGLLKGLFSPLEREVKAGSRSRAEVWKPWLEWMRGFNSMRIFAGVRAEQTVSTNARWLDHDSSKCLGRVLASDPSKSLDIARFLFNSGVSRMDDRDLKIVNSARRARGLPIYESVNSMLSAVCAACGNGVDILADVDGDVAKLFEKVGVKLGSAKYDSDSFGLSDDLDSSKEGGDR